MVRVNIPVTGPDMNWIVGRLAKELVARLPTYGFDAQINRRGPCDIEYHANVYGAPSHEAHVNIGMFAHDDGRPARFAGHFDGHVLLNPEMRDYLATLGARQPVVIEQAVDACFLPDRPPVFGVAGSVKPGNPRKGERFIAKMVEAGYKVRAWGSGWPCPIFSNRYEDLLEFYRSIDYYVCTSTLEGGCSPIIECMAMRIPVIAPRIGFAIVRPVLEYEAGNWASLERVLMYLTQHRTYDDWAADHARYFQRFL